MGELDNATVGKNKKERKRERSEREMDGMQRERSQGRRTE